MKIAGTQIGSRFTFALSDAIQAGAKTDAIDDILAKFEPLLEAEAVGKWRPRIAEMRELAELAKTNGSDVVAARHAYRDTRTA
jgi:hypothetical protein